MTRLTRMTPEMIDGAVVDLVHVIYPDDYYCTPERILSMAHDALVNSAVDDHVREHGPFSDDAAGTAAYNSVAQAQPKFTDLEEAKELLSDLGLMTFAVM